MMIKFCELSHVPGESSFAGYCRKCKNPVYKTEFFAIENHEFVAYKWFCYSNQSNKKYLTNY